VQILFKPAYCESSYSRKIVEECDVQTKFGLHWRDGCSGITLSGVWRFGCASTVIKRWRNGGTGGAGSSGRGKSNSESAHSPESPDGRFHE
jgi:hypothetical protein